MNPIERLVRIYLNSRERLLKDIRRRLAWGRSTGYQEELVALIDQELRKLDLESLTWAKETVEAAYMRGARLAWRAVHAGDRSVKAFASFGGLHKRAVELLAHNTQSYLRITNNLIARQAQDAVRRIGVEITSRKFGEALTWKETTRLLEEKLLDEGFYTVPWRNGRGSMRLDSYAELVARTTTAEATNTGTLNQMREMGKVLVKMTEHNTTCKVCASRQGRVYRTVEIDELPEGDPRRAFPHIREGMPRWPTYKTVHPNCAHRLLPYIWDQKTAEERQAGLADAGKSFDHDPRGEAERIRYEKAQKANADRLRDRKQWERYKAVLGKENVPGFSGFRRMKAASSENYKFMQLDYTRQNRLKQNPNLALPNAGKVIAKTDKFTAYLFNRSSMDGWAKGVAFESRLGYNASNWQALRQSILEAAPKYPAVLRGGDEHGSSYGQNIILKGLKGKPANVVVGWKSQDGKTWMTTAYIKEVKFGDKD